MSNSSTVSDCTKTSYTTLIGLEFSLLCNQDQPDSGDIGRSGADSIEQCLDKCATHPSGHCRAAAFESNRLKCYFKNSTTASTTIRKDGVTLGLVNKEQFQPFPSDCTNNGRNQTSQNGLDFIVYCNQDVTGSSDVCTRDSPSCMKHTASLQECLDHCSTMHPLCTGVSWNPGLESGYMNCYPKNGTSQKLDSSRVPNSKTHFAKTLTGDFSEEDCYSSLNGTTAASNKEVFKLSCGENRIGNDIVAQHADSLAKCIDLCTSYTKANCIGTVYEADMVNGYENCYLKSAIAGGSTPAGRGSTFAMRETTTTNSTPNNPTYDPHQTTQQSSKGNKAWVAGPVIGSVLIIVVILLYIRWWQGKRKRTEAYSANDRNVSQLNLSQQNLTIHKAWGKPELDSVVKYELHSFIRPHELEAN